MLGYTLLLDINSFFAIQSNQIRPFFQRGNFVGNFLGKVISSGREIGLYFNPKNARNNALSTFVITWDELEGQFSREQGYIPITLVKQVIIYKIV